MTKQQKILRVKDIMARGVSAVPAADSQWLITEVFSGHPLWEQKRGVGVERIEIRKMPPFGSLSFWLVRGDGSSVDISYRESLNPSSHHAKVMAAARCEVEPDVFRWKRMNPMPAPGLHCDHKEPPFDALFRSFLEQEGIHQEEQIKIRSAIVGHTDIFFDRELAGRWQAYHRKHATFQWLTAADNIAKSNAA